MRWIGAHRYLSFAAAAGLIAAVAAGRIVILRSEGILSPPVERGRIIESVYGIGTVTATRSYQIKVGVVVHLGEVFVKEGDSVKKGARLVRLESTVYVAPFAGTVTFLPYKEGENVFTNLPILALVDLSDRYLVVSLEQQGALRVKPGQRVKMSFDTMRELSYDGFVESVYSYGGNFMARVNVSDLPPKILPDMTADVAIQIEERDQALLVPVAALDRGAVWVKRGHSVARRVPVQTGIVDKELAEIVSGDLQPGDRVLIKRKLRS